MGEKISKAMLDDLVARGATVGPSAAEAIEGGTKTKIEFRPGPIVGHWLTATSVWTFRIPNWSPTPVNKLYDYHWILRRKHKKNDAEVVAYYGRGVPKATGKRSVSMHVVFPPRKRTPDVDALWKSLLDSLVACGILVNDSAAWASMNPVQYSRGSSLVTFVTVEDL